MANDKPKLRIIGQDENQRLELDYPCSWKYKVIGRERRVLEEAIHSVILERAHSLEHSNASKTGKYVSLNLDLIVQNEDERTFIYEALKAHQDIKMVL